jgi:HAD superfamily phosphatase (TIGR01668 family)
MPITTVLFDLGSTLLYSKDSWPPIFEEADRALAAVLQQAGIPLDGDAFYTEFGGFLDAYYAERGEGTLEKTTAVSLREFLAGKGFQNGPEAVIRAALDAMYAVTQQNWYLEEDAIPTLDTLRAHGYRLGMISNTSDDNNVQQLVDRHGLRPYFEHIVTSAGCGIRKPDGRIFQMALDHFRVRPEAAAMVGDTLEADILGANRMGIYSIWVTRRTGVREDGELAVQPQAVVASLGQIPFLLAEIESDSGL